MMRTRKRDRLITSDELVALAVAAAEDGIAAGELPAGAVVAMGDEVISRAWTQEMAQGRRLVHADLLAMEEADRRLGWRPRPAPLILAVNLEPCLMCLGAAMSLGVERIYYGIESPTDGAATIGAVRRPARDDMAFSRFPEIVGGIRQDEVGAQFARYAATATSTRLREWAANLAGLPACSFPSPLDNSSRAGLDFESPRKGPERMIGTATTSLDDRIKELVEQGKQREEIISILGIGKSSLYRRMNKLGLTRELLSHAAAIPWRVREPHIMATEAQYLRLLSQSIQGHNATTPAERNSAFSWARALIEDGMDITYRDQWRVIPADKSNWHIKRVYDAAVKGRKRSGLSA
ncbi:nucleoside deaminase [Nonomuraea dietziae]|uniref:nucleoside deaminase n=1 Tax=Nonomuraea dietziae TaxID=65515 RepID=UPI00343273DB